MPSSPKHTQLLARIQAAVLRGDIPLAEQLAKDYQRLTKPGTTRAGINKGYRWYNNGKYDVRSLKPPKGKGWVLGKLPCGSGPKPGSATLHWYNNGLRNIRAAERPGPDWVAGMVRTPEQKALRQTIASNIPKTEETREKISKAMKGNQNNRRKPKPSEA